MDFIEQFKNWLKLKIKLWQKETKVVFKQGEIWWCSLGFNIGEEIYGKGENYTRPVLNQARTLDKKRLRSRIITLDKNDYNEVKKRFIEFYGF